MKVGEYGRHGQSEARDLLALLDVWDQAGRPASSRLRVRAYSPDFPYPLAPGETQVLKHWTKIVVDWPNDGAS